MSMDRGSFVRRSAAAAVALLTPWEFPAAADAAPAPPPPASSELRWKPRLLEWGFHNNTSDAVIVKLWKGGAGEAVNLGTYAVMAHAMMVAQYAHGLEPCAPPTMITSRTLSAPQEPHEESRRIIGCLPQERTPTWFGARVETHGATIHGPFWIRWEEI